MKGILKILGTKTAFGGILATAAWLFQQDAIDPLTVTQALGAALTIIGGRHAIEKSGPQK